jgi:EAL domain-containing protein (putative c-di-GMP-specific phosphodiesterase class I)
VSPCPLTSPAQQPAAHPESAACMPWTDWVWSANTQGIVTSCVQPPSSGEHTTNPPLLVGAALWEQPDVAWSQPNPGWLASRLQTLQPLRNLWGLWTPKDKSPLNLVLCGQPGPNGGPAGWHGGITTSDTQDAPTPRRMPAPAHLPPRSPTEPLQLLNHIDQALSAERQSAHQSALMVVNLLDTASGMPTLRPPPDSPAQRQQIQNTLQTVMRPQDAWGRLGPGEWGVFVSDLGTDPLVAATIARQVANRLLASLNALDLHHALASEGWECVAGIAMMGQRTSHAQSALNEARQAVTLQRHKTANGVWMADPALHAQLSSRVNLEVEFQTAIAQGELRLFFQPVVNIHASTIGAEALVRWQHPKNGLISPAHFIGMAEETGLIIPMGWWVLRAACQQLAEWARVPYKASWTIAVNVSAKQFLQNNFVDEVQSILVETGINPRRLKLELTESVMVQHVEDAIAKMSVLQAQGIKFSLDDFGTGYSSLSYLKRLPLQQLKIDQSFVRDIHNDPNDAAIVKTILALAHSMELSVVAEGVETLEQEEFLIAAGCRYMQGYLYGRPVPVSQWA